MVRARHGPASERRAVSDLFAAATFGSGERSDYQPSQGASQIVHREPR
jgi:hypothetical protein